MFFLRPPLPWAWRRMFPGAGPLGADGDRSCCRQQYQHSSYLHHATNQSINAKNCNSIILWIDFWVRDKLCFNMIFNRLNKLTYRVFHKCCLLRICTILSALPLLQVKTLPGNTEFYMLWYKMTQQQHYPTKPAAWQHFRSFSNGHYLWNTVYLKTGFKEFKRSILTFSALMGKQIGCLGLWSTARSLRQGRLYSGIRPAAEI